MMDPGDPQRPLSGYPRCCRRKIFNDTCSAKSDVYRFKIGQDEKELFLQPGSRLKMKFDAKNFYETFEIEGKGATEIVVLDSLSEQFVRTVDFDLINEGAPDLVSRHIDSVYDLNIGYLSELSKRLRVSEAYIDYQKATWNMIVQV